jgi:hypothetical protein
MTKPKEKDSFSPKNSEESKEKTIRSPKISIEKKSNSFTTHPKSGKRRKNKKSTFKDSIGQCYPFSIEQKLGLTKLFEGTWVQENFKLPLNLRTAFNVETKLNGDSSCQEQRRFMFNYVAASRIERLSLGDTLSKIVSPKFSIGQMNFTQNVQSRPRRYVSNNPDAELTVDGSHQCQFGDCENVAVETWVYQPKDGKPDEREICASCVRRFAGSSSWHFKSKAFKQTNNKED